MGFFKTLGDALDQHERQTQTRKAQVHELKAGKTLRRTKHHLKKAEKADKRANRAPLELHSFSQARKTRDAIRANQAEYRARHRAEWDARQRARDLREMYPAVYPAYPAL